MEELIKLPHFSTLGEFTLNGIPEAFDLETFYSYMKQNKITKFDFTFDDSISETYKNRLEEIVDEILTTEILGYKPPCIDFADLKGINIVILNRLNSQHKTKQNRIVSSNV